MSRTLETEQRYHQRARQLLNRYRVETGQVGDAVVPVAWATWLVQLRPGLRPASWRQYRAAVVWYLGTLSGVPTTAAALAMLAAVEAPYTPIKALPKRSAAQKAKQLPDRQLWPLLQQLLRRRGPWGIAAAYWLLAGRLTGLREGEWAQAQWVDEPPHGQLQVLNAKATNGRGNGPLRTLHLDGLTETQRQWVHTHWITARHWQAQGAFGYFQAQCQRAVRVAARTLWPRRGTWPTLYSARHQCAADAKASGLSQSEVAALLGHAALDTAGRHYGKRRSGTPGGLRVTPDAADVARLGCTMDDCGPSPR